MGVGHSSFPPGCDVFHSRSRWQTLLWKSSCEGWNSDLERRRHLLHDTKGQRSWDRIPKRPALPKRIPTNQHPDPKSGPGASCHLHHEVNIHEDAHEWEIRQTGYLGTKQSLLYKPQGDLERDPQPTKARKGGVQLPTVYISASIPAGNLKLEEYAVWGTELERNSEGQRRSLHHYLLLLRFLSF